MSNSPIECVGDFLKIINALSKENKDKQLYFRGQSDASWGIDSSLSRLLNKSNIRPLKVEGTSLEWGLKISRSRLAKDLFESFKEKFVLYSETNIIKDYILNDIDLHVMAQHYEFPTRVVDVTRNPLIALYFATEKCKKDKDVSVFIFHNGFEVISSKYFLKKINDSKNTYTDFYKEIIPFLSHDLVYYKSKLLETLLAYDYGDFSVNDLLFLCDDKIHPAYLKLLHFANQHSNDDIILKLKKMACGDGFNYNQPHSSIEIFNDNFQIIEPLPINQRIKNQQGLLLFSPSIDKPIFPEGYFTEKNKIDRVEFSEQLDKNSKCYKIDIKCQFVEVIKKELERYGISRDFIYPELENFSTYLKEKIVRKYTN
ncbi:FRG domain-containing protein [Pectobacterium versatile]|uniref:FRG domain-containing protein n=1 Tax=Pectobacterium versatile TaxID=2488639 RepID=UPI0015DECB53|nr:FRG domain-containing protein [Pectobacterium versatile]MBA0170454.1 FRG domain-containing protein [Pectobacterium versatile]